MKKRIRKKMMNMKKMLKHSRLKIKLRWIKLERF
jgi:hypothetical protein